MKKKKNENIKQKIIKFIDDQIGIKINSKTPLFEELELIGDDADIFISNFSKKFNVDFSNFNFIDYFVEESNIPFYYFYLKKFNVKKIKRKIFYLNHLEEVVVKGMWFPPETESTANSKAI